MLPPRPVKLLYVVQRYGSEVAGGAELHCRQFASRLVERGHEVTVLTSRAIDHTDWANHYAPGWCEVDGVRVHRLTVDAKDRRRFESLSVRMGQQAGRRPFSMQKRWLELKGPLMPELVPFLAEHAAEYDAVIFFTYLFHPTWAGLPVSAMRVPTVLHPTAHDEPFLYMPLYDSTFRHPWGFAFSTVEEMALVQRRFGVSQVAEVIGIGVDLEAQGNAANFRRAFGLGTRPYLLYVGRVEGGKGAPELHAFFAAYKERSPGPLALVFLGKDVEPLPGRDDVIVTGFVDKQTKHDAIAGALALAQPSYFESFSMVLTEAWAQECPALVQGRSEVLVGQARRSGGGLPYRGFAEFEAAVDRLVHDPDLARTLGTAGRRYVEATYQWDSVLSRYEQFVNRVRSSRTLVATIDRP